MPEDQKNDLAHVGDLEIEPLSDEALETVAGGTAAGSSNGCCSCKGCSPPPADVELA
ncbi:MAG TPA: hypothetical protein VGS07_21335 [Thermoanaerobaculia bacterium]|jgi:hypothetical protein|nr:hypothetical protein [Thermoanaerobaculia bacterium]